MTNVEMKNALANAGVTDDVIKMVQDKYDAEAITKIAEAAHTPEEAFEAINRVYPELDIDKMQEQMDFYAEQYQASMENAAEEVVELTECELSMVDGGGFFSKVGNFFKKNWKKIVVGAAIVVGAVTTGILIGTGVLNRVN